MTPYVRLFGAIVIVAAAVPAVPPSARATIYQCLDPSGAKVLTDTPAQLRNCTALNAGPNTPSTRPPARVQEPTEGSPSLAPTPAFPPSAPPFPIVPSTPSTVSPMQPSDPTASEPPVDADADDDDEPPLSGQAPPSAQPCGPRLNPLSPFGFVNCPPSVPPTASSPAAATPSPMRPTP